MLVLTRLVDEKILIGDLDGDHIVITLCQIRNGTAARIGVEAPRDLLIRRLKPDGNFEAGQENWQREKPAKAANGKGGRS